MRAKFSTARVELVRRSIWEHGIAKTLDRLGMGATTLDRILGPGLLTTAAIERLGPRIDGLAYPPKKMQG